MRNWMITVIQHLPYKHMFSSQSPVLHLILQCIADCVKSVRRLADSARILIDFLYTNKDYQLMTNITILKSQTKCCRVINIHSENGTLSIALRSFWKHIFSPQAVRHWFQWSFDVIHFALTYQLEWVRLWSQWIKVMRYDYVIQMSSLLKWAPWRKPTHSHSIYVLGCHLRSANFSYSCRERAPQQIITFTCEFTRYTLTLSSIVCG